MSRLKKKTKEEIQQAISRLTRSSDHKDKVGCEKVESSTSESKILGEWTAEFEEFEDAEGNVYHPGFSFVLKRKGRVLALVEPGPVFASYSRAYVFDRRMRCAYTADSTELIGDNDCFMYKARRWCEKIIETYDRYERFHFGGMSL